MSGSPPAASARRTPDATGIQKELDGVRLLTDLRPGLNPERLLALMEAAVARCRLDLSGRVVFTEAASGAYCVTPIIAAIAGAKHVYALARATAHGTVEEVSKATLDLAERAVVRSRLEIVTEKSSEILAKSDIITNSGHVRPIDSKMIGWLRPTAVIPLMYEAWEFRAEDLDLEACRKAGIHVAGTNERHPAVNVFSYLGTMAAKLLLDAGIEVHGSRIILACDNPFLPFIEKTLRGIGAEVEAVSDLSSIAEGARKVDAVLWAMKPGGVRFSQKEAKSLSRNSKGAVLVQYWGDVDETAIKSSGIFRWPATAPGPGHMGILPSGIGPEPIVRLQAGGLKVGEILCRAPGELMPGDQEFIDAI
jgi:hypothetical protein